MLGLYNEIYAKREAEAGKQVYRVIEGREDQVYPRSFDFTYGSDTDDTIARNLFGDLVAVVKNDQDVSSGLAVKPLLLGKLQAGSTKNVNVKHGHGPRHATSRTMTHKPMHGRPVHGKTLTTSLAKV